MLEHNHQQILFVMKNIMTGTKVEIYLGKSILIRMISKISPVSSINTMFIFGELSISIVQANNLEDNPVDCGVSPRL